MIQIKNLSKTYFNKYNTVKALDNLQLILPDNGMNFIFGESGNGKSTFLNILSGLDSYNVGNVLIDGKELSEFTKKEMYAYRCNHIGFVFQDVNLLDSLTIGENIKLARNINGLAPSETELKEILAKLNLTGFEKRLPRELSGGEKQRVAVARTLLTKPKILFVDEPTGHLDEVNTKIIWDIIKEVSKDTLVIAVSHEEDIVEAYADRIIELKKGRIVRDVFRKLESKKQYDELLVKINNDEVTNKLELKKKGKFGVKNTFKLSFKNLAKNKVRTSLLVVLCSFAFLFFSAFFILNNYNPNRVLAESAINQNDNYAIFNADKTGKQITSFDLDKIKKDTTYDDNYRISKTNLNLSFVESSKNQFNNSTHKQFKVGGIIEIDAPSINGVGHTNLLNQNILAGVYPTTGSPKNAIVISDYFANILTRYNILYNAAGNVESPLVVTDINQIIGKEIKLNDEYFYVSGIYKTDYSKHIDMTSFQVSQNADLDEYKFSCENVYNIIHVQKGFIAERIKNISSASDVYVKSSKNTVNSNVELANIYTKQSFGGSADEYKLNTKVTDINKNCIVIPTVVYKKLFDITTQSYDEIVVADNLKAKFVFNGGDEREYNVVGITKNFTNFIVGDENFSVDGLDIATLGKNFDSVARESVFPSYVLVTNKPDEQKLTNLIKTYSGMGYNFTSTISDNIADFSGKVEIFKSAFLAVSIFTAIFASVFMYIFMYQMIADRKKDIGILAAVGATMTNIFNIFFISAIVIMLAIVLLTSAFTVILTLIINAVVKSAISLPFTMFNLNFLTFGLVLGLCIVVTILATIIPIILIARKKPSEIMKKF